MTSLADIELALESARADAEDTADYAARLLAIGETVLELWVSAHGMEPTTRTRERFRLLALHRQGARDDPSFNACRETCRELVYHYNLLRAGEKDEVPAGDQQMMYFVARHLLLFVGGKLQESGLGNFCCSSRPLRQTG